jgi:hypothetical protein
MTDAKPSEVTKAARRKLEELVNGTASRPAAVQSSLPPCLLSREELDAVMAESGILPSDQLYPFFMVLGEGIRHVAAGSEALNARVATAAEAEIERVTAAVLKVETESVERMSQALDQSTRTLFRSVQLRTMVVLACALVATLATGVAGGWWLGWKDGRRDIAHLEGRLEEAFRDGTDGAEAWLMLMENNDPKTAMEKCHDKLVFESQERRACYVPLWIEEKSRTPK